MAGGCGFVDNRKRPKALRRRGFARVQPSCAEKLLCCLLIGVCEDCADPRVPPLRVNWVVREDSVGTRTTAGFTETLTQKPSGGACCLPTVLAFPEAGSPAQLHGRSEFFAVRKKGSGTGGSKLFGVYNPHSRAEVGDVRPTKP